MKKWNSIHKTNHAESYTEIHIIHIDWLKKTNEVFKVNWRALNSAPCSSLRHSSQPRKSHWFIDSHTLSPGNYKKKRSERSHRPPWRRKEGQCVGCSRGPLERRARPIHTNCCRSTARPRTAAIKSVVSMRCLGLADNPERVTRSLPVLLSCRSLTAVLVLFPPAPHTADRPPSSSSIHRCPTLT